MRVQIRFLLVILVLVAGGGVSSAGESEFVTRSCSCNPLPTAGVYADAEPITLSYLDGDADNCPTAIRLQARRTGAPDMDVVLACNVDSNSWSGAEPSPFGGPFLYELTVPAPVPGMGDGGFSKQLAASLGSSDQIELDMMMPPQLVMMGKPNLHFSLTLARGRKLAPCICQNVREELDFVLGKIEDYSNPGLLAVAAARNMRGKANTEKYWMDEGRRLHQFAEGQSELSYENLVKRYGNGEISETGAVIPDAKPEPQTAADKRGAVQGGVQVGALGITRSIDCRIVFLDHYKVGKLCMPSIVLRATNVHETMHRARCMALNSPSRYILPDGTEIDWQKHTDSSLGGVKYDGKPYPASGYDAWAQLPQNLSIDEAAAYTAEAKVLHDWLSENCPVAD